jgi:rfaE bifunctional protein nucleotidyltransferase chain/domain
MPILSKLDAGALVKRLRAGGKTVVFTNGVFDLLHPGHIRYLEEARRHGDALIVGVNSDRSVLALKGPGRPIHPQDERAEIVAALRVVDAAVIFDEDTPHAIITALQPDVLVKGADWPADQIVGRDVVEARGGRVVRVAVAAGHSSTALIERMRRGAPQTGLLTEDAGSRSTRDASGSIPPAATKP